MPQIKKINIASIKIEDRQLQKLLDSIRRAIDQLQTEVARLQKEKKDK